MIFKQCPICGRYMTPNMSETNGWYQCVCGYDSRTYLYTYTNHSSDFDYGKEGRRMARRLKDIIIHLGYVDEYKDGKVEVNIIASEPEELIRCKDCKHRNITSDGFGECDVMDRQFLDDEYCSFGEKKTNGNNYNPTLTTDVTHCSECKYYIESTCAITNEPQQEEHFCSWGSGE